MSREGEGRKARVEKARVEEARVAKGEGDSRDEGLGTDPLCFACFLTVRLLGFSSHYRRNEDACCRTIRSWKTGQEL